MYAHIYTYIRHLFFGACVCVTAVLGFGLSHDEFIILICLLLLHTCCILSFLCKHKGACPDCCKIHLKPKCRFGSNIEPRVFAKHNAVGYSGNSGTNQHAVVCDWASLFANSCGRSTKPSTLSNLKGCEWKQTTPRAKGMNEKMKREIIGWQVWKPAGRNIKSLAFTSTDAKRIPTKEKKKASIKARSAF